jgi:hypothetical protein
VTKFFSSPPQASIERLQHKDRSAFFDFKGLEMRKEVTMSPARFEVKALALARLAGRFCFNRQALLALYI